MALVPYVLPATRNVRYKLDLNESPLALPEAITQRFAELARNSQTISLYPVEDEVHNALVEAIATSTQTTKENVVVTAGSDEALRLIASTYGGAGKSFQAFTPTYTFALQQFQAQGCEIRTNPWNPESLRQTPPSLLYLCTPNNPDGRLWNSTTILQLAVDLPSTLIIIDEAYVEFGGQSIAARVREYENLVVTRTFSKAYGLAGLRIGYLLTSESRAELLRTLYNPKTVTQVAKSLALCALTTAQSAYRSQIAEVLYAREHLRQHLSLLDPVHLSLLTPEESGGNFLFLQSPHTPTLLPTLLTQDIALRDRSSLVPESFRITIGNNTQMKHVLGVLCRILPTPASPVHLLVLAAGCGTRIQPFWGKHKCLLEVQGEPLLQRMCRQFRAAFGARLIAITVVTGYQHQALENATHTLGVNYVYNPEYQNSNNWRSMLVGLQAAQSEATVIALDGDLILADELVDRLSYIHREHSVLVVDSSSACDPEAMKAYGQGATVVELSKAAPTVPTKALGEFIGITVVAPTARELLVEELTCTSDSNEYYEHAWTRAITQGTVAFRTLDTWGAPWYEIDTQEDYEGAVAAF